MSPKRGFHPTDILAAKIAVLSLINDIPEQPIINTTSQYTGHLQSDQAVSFQHEVSITQNLAFICAYSGDPLHVLAVCIEEANKPDTLTIRIAANTGKHERLLNALKPVTSILQNEAIGVDRPTNRETLLKAVVALNRSRIFCRIRSRHATDFRSKTKTSFLSRLATASDLLRNSSVSATRIQSLANGVADLQKQFDALEEMSRDKAQNSEGESCVLRIIKTCNSVLYQHENDLRKTPYTPGPTGNLWTGNATEALIEKLRKIGHYIKASDDLLRAARIYSIFSTIAVELVDLQQRGRCYPLDAASAAVSSQIIDASCTQKTFAKISSRRHQSISATKDQISSRLGKNTRVHAEIQLVLYYEQNPRLLRPRVICSSKSACYLCQLFFNLHGQYHVPSSHGRLYDTWKWPVQSEAIHGLTTKIISERVLPAFQEAIDRKIYDCLNVAVLPRIDPLESRVHLLYSMTPSILSTNSRNSNTGIETVRYQNRKVTAQSSSSDIIDTYKDSSQDTGSSTPTTRPPIPASSTHETDTPTTRQTFRNTDDDTTPSPKITPKNSIPNIPSLSKTQVPDMSTKKGRVAISTPPSSPSLILDLGDITHQIFDANNQTLRIKAPGLHVTLECALQVSDRSLLLGVECFALPADPGFSSECLNMDDRNWKEKLAPEDVLFSEEGLRLRRRDVVVRIRVLSKKD